MTKRQAVKAFQGNGLTGTRDISLNYVWINESPEKARGDLSLMGVPYHFLNRAYRNARRYKQAQTTVWIDPEGMKDHEISLIDTGPCDGKPGDVRFRSLKDIPAYADEPMFQQGSQTGIWAKVDYARLLVIQHVFDEQPHIRDVVYADFDIENVKIGDQGYSLPMKNYGMLFADTSIDLIENSYMAFRRGDGEIVLKEKLMPDTKRMALINENGYGPLLRVSCEWPIGRDGSISGITRRLAHKTGYKMPLLDPLKKNHIYYDFRL